MVIKERLKSIEVKLDHDELCMLFYVVACFGEDRDIPEEFAVNLGKLMEKLSEPAAKQLGIR